MTNVAILGGGVGGLSAAHELAERGFSVAMSPEYQRLMAIGLTRSLVAMRAQVASTKTVGDILLQLIIEGANEAARRAVNAILLRSGSDAPRCELWPLEEPLVFAPLREYDYFRYSIGWAHGKYF